MSLLPILYHTHHTLYAKDLPFWVKLADKIGGPVLELGCGTGRVLLTLAEKGLSTFGLDIDPDMLVFLRGQIKPGFIPVPVVFCADMTAYHLQSQFPLIIMPCNTLSSLTRRERLSALQLVQKHLAPDGLFAAALPNPNALEELDELGENEVEEVFPHPSNGKPVQVSSQWIRDTNQFHLQWNYDILEPDGCFQRVEIRTSHSLDPVSRYLEDFSAAKLIVADLYGGADFSPYSQDSDELFLIAENNQTSR